MDALSGEWKSRDGLVQRGELEFHDESVHGDQSSVALRTHGHQLCDDLLLYGVLQAHDVLLCDELWLDGEWNDAHLHGFDDVRHEQRHELHVQLWHVYAQYRDETLPSDVGCVDGLHEELSGELRSPLELRVGTLYGDRHGCPNGGHGHALNDARHRVH